jgi:hypothetical protein
LSVYSQLNEILIGHDNQRQLAAYIQDPMWEELEHLVGDILRRSPPICFYIDAVDEEFANRGESHIRVLDWDHQAITYFLHDKLARLPDQYWCRPDDPLRGVGAWLGRTSVHNEVRAVDEPVERRWSGGPGHASDRGRGARRTGAHRCRGVLRRGAAWEWAVCTRPTTLVQAWTSTPGQRVHRTRVRSGARSL